ncbi:hypothetical protein KIN20_025475 [Parelaphostrongylus tenuis]|uniref:Uncharacterized protein n=1 Tax=Parelaphostrongylus tenuis TaxID=148309 RepID=A0AAD5MVA5_PARTN|nr:hypothetical protein KIN20_025475 [Parelaphostrongylus tenuis]
MGQRTSVTRERRGSSDGPAGSRKRIKERGEGHLPHSDDVERSQYLAVPQK